MRGIQRRRSIERKVIRVILWVGILPITMALIAGYIIAHEGQKKTVLGNLFTAAQTTANGLRLAMQYRLRPVIVLAHDPDVVAALEAGASLAPAARDALIVRLDAEAKTAIDGYSQFSLFDADGNLLLSTGRTSDVDQAHTDWGTRVLEPMFIGFKYQYEHNRYMARAVAPVMSPATGQRVGYVCEDQEAIKLLHYALGRDMRTEEDDFGQDVYQIAYASGRGGLLITYLDQQPSPMLQLDTADLTLGDRITQPDAGESGTLRIRDYATRGKHIDVLLAYHRFMGGGDQFKIYIVVYRPATAVFRNINQWARSSMLGAVILIGVFCIFAYRHVHNKIMVPLSLLNEGAQIIRQGDLDLKLKIATGDEIEELASSFNKMALALSQNMRQLEGSEEKYRNLITSMRDGIYQTDAEGVFLFVNPAGAEIFGYASPEDAIGHNLRDLFLEEIDYARMASELTKQAFVERTRVWMKRTDGRAICVEISGNRTLDDEGAFVGVEGIFRDVTSAVRLEQQARERSERISAINQIANVINSSIEAGRLHESLIVELKKVVDFDYAAVALLGERGDVFERRRLWPESHSSSASLAVQPSRAAAWVARQRKSLSIEDTAEPLPSDLPPDITEEFPGETRSCLCVPLYATGRIVGTLNLGSNAAHAFSKHDIEVLEEISPHVAVAMRNARLLESLQQSLDEVTRARERLHEANEELKTLDEMKTNLLSNVSHELRTPLVAVMGYTDMMYNRKVGPITDTQAEYLGIILRNIEKLVTLIENLLDFSRLHRGTERLVFAPFDLVECARASIQNVQPVADSRGITVECVATDEGVLVEGDKGKMGQVFNNLLSNAVKFNSSGGRVTVGIERRDDSVEVVVSDTGIGIPPEAQDKVFTRFYQYDSSSTRKYGGTGIGLSIAQDIVRLHGSRITVTSEVGKGSTFRFALPLTMPQAVADDEAGGAVAGAEPPLPRETHLLVLLITLDRGLNLQMHDFLLPEGIELIHAAHAESAVALTQKYHPDCVLVDADGSGVSPGGGEGLVALDGVLADPVGASLPVVLITNSDALYDTYRRKVTTRVRHGFRKSGLLSAIHFAISHDTREAEPLGGKILCVDDDPEIVIFITRCLETEGYAVDACGSGEEALAHASSRQYGLVLLDIAMPGLDGWETCRRLKADSALEGIKVHFVTAKPIDGSAARLQEVGADGYLLKPFKPEDLVELARSIIPAPQPENPELSGLDSPPGLSLS